MDNIEDIVKNVVQGMSQHHMEQGSRLENLWQELLNQEELKHTKLIGENEGVVLVYVESSAWLYQMRVKVKKYLERIQQDIPDIKRIQFKIGKVT